MLKSCVKAVESAWKKFVKTPDFPTSSTSVPGYALVASVFLHSLPTRATQPFSQANTLLNSLNSTFYPLSTGPIKDTNKLFRNYL